MLRGRAFSIVELIVVIAALAALLGLLLPALGSAAGASRSLKCQSNLRQMAVAAQSYAAVFDAFPIARRYQANKHISWDYVAVGTQVIGQGALWNFCTNADEIHQCPDYHGPANLGEVFSGYNYNTSYIGGEEFQFPGGSTLRAGVPIGAFRRAATCAMFGDAGRIGGTNRYMRAPLRKQEGLLVSWPAIYTGGQAFRHGKLTNIAFADGHVGNSNNACKGRHATQSLLTNSMGYPSNGFLSEDDGMYDPR